MSGRSFDDVLRTAWFWLTWPIRALVTLPLLLGFLIVGWLHLREQRKRRGRRG